MKQNLRLMDIKINELNEIEVYLYIHEYHTYII